MVEANQLADDVGGRRARIGGELDEADLTRDGQPLEKLGTGDD